MSTNVVSVRVPDDLKTRLDALSAATGRPSAFYVREAVARHIDDLEWAYGIAATAESVRAGTEPVRALDEVAADLGFDPDELRGLARATNADSES